MAQYNTLTEFTTDVADALREKTGGVGLISPQDFAALIRALPSNSGEPIAGEIRIFYDNTQPASVLGGSWDEKVFPYGTFLMAAGEGGTAGQKGGSADAVVVKHNHDVLTYLQSGSYSGDSYLAIKYDTGYIYTSSPTYTNKNQPVCAEDTGVDGTGKNRPPYITVHFWRKVS